MNIYNYDPHTGVLLSSGIADANPMDPADPIVPGFATPSPPPAVPGGSVPVYRAADDTVPQTWSLGAWSIAEDFRAVPLYRTGDGSAYALSAQYMGIGPVPTWLTTSEKPGAAYVWMNGAWQLDQALLAAQAMAASRIEKAAREARARSAMEPLQMAVDIDLATPDEAARLLAWKRYFVLLSRVDLANPVWPEEPAA